jgi:hypothetical protein
MKQTSQIDTNEIDWASFNTAYGSADCVPDQLASLGSNQQEIALKAAHDLWCGLCHQHAFISSASLPAFPYIIATLETANDLVSIEILDILVGFSSCNTDGVSHQDWIDSLHQCMRQEQHRFLLLAENGNPIIADFASTILENLKQ